MPRTKAFDPDEALERAMEVFWVRGYEGASMKALLDAMGISRQSLYDTFGDKQQLFEQALDRYAQRNVSAMLEELEQPGADVAAIRRFFEQLPAMLLAFPERRACLMANTMSTRLAGPDSASSATMVAAHRDRLTEAFLGPLDRAAGGETGASTSPRPTLMSPRALAEALTAMVLGITVISRSGAPEEALVRMAGAAIAMAGLSGSPEGSSGGAGRSSRR